MRTRVEHHRVGAESRAEDTVGKEDHHDHARDVQQEAEEAKPHLRITRHMAPDPKQDGEELRMDVPHGEVQQLGKGQLGLKG